MVVVFFFGGLLVCKRIFFWVVLSFIVVIIYCVSDFDKFNLLMLFVMQELKSSVAKTEEGVAKLVAKDSLKRELQ